MNNKDRKVTIVAIGAIIFALGLWAGNFTGVAHYKSTCETISDTKSIWLECER